MKSAALLVALLMGGVSPFSGAASAAGHQDVYHTLFGDSGRKAACFARRYDDKHLERHPKQRVAEIFLSSDHLDTAQADYRIENSPEKATVLLGVRLKGKTEWDTEIAYCSPRDIQARKTGCGVEGDAGGFELSLVKDGILRLEADEIYPENATGRYELLGVEKGDDKVFLLYEAPSANCDPDQR